MNLRLVCSAGIAVGALCSFGAVWAQSAPLSRSEVKSATRDAQTARQLVPAGQGPTVVLPRKVSTRATFTASCSNPGPGRKVRRAFG
jgi:hypothetical protein